MTLSSTSDFAAGEPQAVKASSTSTQRLLGIYAGGVPGTAYATQALRWAKQAGFGVVLNYSSVDATPQAISAYLGLAHQLNLKVILSLSDLLGPKDLDQDPGDQRMHRQFGSTTDDQVRGIVRRFANSPAVWGFSISDELPQDSTDLAKWLPALQQRQVEITALTAKPTLVTLYWSGPELGFYQKVKSATTDLAIDYYPFPQNPTYGPVDAINVIGMTLGKVAGSNGWFTLQGFGWGNGNHPEGKGLGFSSTAAAPTATQMVGMAKSAVENGAHNIMVFSYDDSAPNGYNPDTPGDPAQLAAIAAAARTITTSNWWRTG